MLYLGKFNTASVITNSYFWEFFFNEFFLSFERIKSLVIFAS